MTAFTRQLHYGVSAESAISRWLQGRGWSVMPVYEKLIDEGKGPQIFQASGPLIAPDLFVFNGQRAMWVEAKHKNAFTWHRITERWATGIDRRHYHDYLQVANSSPWPLWLLFLHDGGQAKDSPPASPAGLFGNEIAILERCINHQSDNWGRSGMVYWAYESLRRLPFRITSECSPCA